MEKTKYNQKTYLFYISTIKSGGAARVMVNLANEFVDAGYKIVFVTNFPSETDYILNERVIRENIRSSEFHENAIKKNLYRCKKLRQIIKRYKPNLALSFMAENNFRLIISTIGFHTKTVISVRSDPRYEYSTVLRKILAQVLFRFASGIVFQTKQAQQMFPRAIIKKSTIIANEVANVFYSTKHVKDDYFVAVGRLVPPKNYELMINAFARFTDDFPNAVLRIYGEGERRTQLENLISTLNAVNNIKLMGQVEDIASVLSHASAFILSSNIEGMPNALLEAQAMGLPCISTDCPSGGPAEIIQNGKNGILIPPNDEDALVNALKRIAVDTNYAKNLGKYAHDSAMKYNPISIFSRWESYLNSV